MKRSVILAVTRKPLDIGRIERHGVTSLHRWSYIQYSIFFHKGGVRITHTPTLALIEYKKQPMSEQEVLVPTEIRTVAFYDDEITGALVQVEDVSQIYVPLRPLAHFLGLNWSAQYRRALRDEILAPEIRGVAIMATPQEGGTQEMICLPLDFLPGWLFGITTSKVKPEYREKIARYRRECYRRLWEAFAPSIVPAPAPISQSSGAALAYETAMAVAALAREQMELEARQVQQEGRLNAAAQWAKGIDARVTALEVRQLPDTQINTSQVAELALQVKAVANALEQRGQERGYQRVYGELYRRFSIESYKSLPQSRFDEAKEWLRGWYDEITGEDAR